MELSLKYFIKRNIRNQTIVCMLLAVIVILIAIYTYPTLINMFGYYKLDHEEAFIDIRLFDIQGSSKPHHYSEYDKYKYDTGDFGNYLNTYKQGNRYKFRIKPVEVYDLGIYTETTYNITLYGVPNPNDTKVTNYKVVALDTGEAFVLTRVKPSFEVTTNHVYKGVFVPLEKKLVDKLEEVLGDEGKMHTVFTYEFDTTNSFFFYRFTDFVFLFIPFIMLVFYGIKLIIYISNYRNHPTYMLLDKMPNEPHEIEAFINSELADKDNVSINKNVYTTKNWIIKKDLFKTHICRAAKSSRFGD